MVPTLQLTQPTTKGLMSMLCGVWARLSPARKDRGGDDTLWRPRVHEMVVGLEKGAGKP